METLFLAEWFAFMGRKADPDVPGSPYKIDFLPTAPESSGMRPMNVTVYSCGDTSLGCSCGDCPSSPVCSSSVPPPSYKKGSCSVRIGSLKAKCFDFAIAILYIILVTGFLGWSLFHRKGEMNPAHQANAIHRVDLQKDENPSTQVHQACHFSASDL
ncbi:NPC intracellular cholesterol transporter 1 [Sarracenia purpurea var. burkii]